MPFSTDGVYTIKNIARDLMLDLKEGDTTEGNQIQGFVEDGTAAQQVFICVCTHLVTSSYASHLPVDNQETLRVRVLKQNRHHSVRYQRHQWKWIFYCCEPGMLLDRHSFICLLVDVDVCRIRMNRSFTPRRRLSSILFHRRIVPIRENLTQCSATYFC